MIGRHGVLFFCFLTMPLVATDYDLMEYGDPDEAIDRIGSTAIPGREPVSSKRGSNTSESFATGRTTTSFYSGDDNARSIAFQTNGGFIVVGRCYDGSEYHACFSRYLGNGNLDTTFRTTGKFRFSWGDTDDLAHSVVIQTDGRALVGGRSANGTNHDFLLVRLQTNGDLDTSFGTQGVRLISFGNSTDIARSLSLDTLGRSLLGGYTRGGTSYVPALARVSTDGTLDTSFNTTGLLVFTLGTGSNALNEVIPLTSGGIAAAGGLFTDNWDAALIRLTSNGQLDTAFNTTGILLTSYGTGQDFFYSVREVPARFLQAAGSARRAANLDAVIARFISNGRIDTSFATTGAALISFSTRDDVVYSQVLDTNNSSVFAGYTATSATTDGNNFIAFRLNSSGAIDSFWRLGSAVLAFDTTNDEAFAIGRWEGGGPPVAVGRSHNGDLDFAIARINMGTFGIAGDLDYTFGTVGYQTIYPRNYAAGFAGPNNRYYYIARNPPSHLGRTLPNGAADTSFATTGEVLLGSAYDGGQVRLTDDNRVLVAYLPNNSQEVALKRFYSNGTLDTTFGTAGVARSTFLRDASDLVIASNGKFLIAGYASGDLAVGRFHTNGTADTSFMTTGIFTDGSGRALSMTLTPDERLLVTGFRTRNGGALRALLYRLNTNGSLDTSFATTGVVNFGVGPDSPAAGYIVKQDAVGRILMTGYQSFGLDDAEWAFVTRWNSNGTLDTSFNTHGILNRYSEGKSRIFQFSLNGDGSYAGTTSRNTGIGLIRIRSNGTLDSSFGSNGMAPLPAAVTWIPPIIDASGAAHVFENYTKTRYLP